MDTKSITRKEFITLTFTLIGTTALVGSSCDDDEDIDVITPGTGGRGGTTGAAGQTGAGGAAGSGGGASCAASQVSDSLGHVHTLTVSTSILSATTAQTVVTGTADGHTHNVILSTANQSTLSGGGTVTVTSELADGHVHMYTVTC